MLLNDPASLASSGSLSSANRTSKPPDAISVAALATRRSGLKTRVLVRNPSSPAANVISSTPKLRVVLRVVKVRETSVNGNASK